MPSIDKPCTVFNAFNFKRDVEDRIGHLLKLKIGDKEIKADMSLRIPTNDSSEEKVVGAISHLHWDGGIAEPFQITSQISLTNKNEVATLLHTSLKSVVVTVSFNIYEYDKESKKYFLAFHTNNTEIKGLLQTQGSERVLYLADQPSSEVLKPENYQLVVGFVPEDEQQTIHMAVSENRKFVKPWGVTRTK